MKQIISLIAGLGLAALVNGCAGPTSVRTQDSPVDRSVSSTRYESTTDRFDRLREIDPSSGGSALSVDGYVMKEAIQIDLMSIAGVYSGTVKVTSDGKGHFSAKGRYFPLDHPEAMERALREADTNGDRIITFKEAEELLLRVYKGYTAGTGFPEVDEGVDTEGNMFKRVYDNGE